MRRGIYPLSLYSDSEPHALNGKARVNPVAAGAFTDRPIQAEPTPKPKPVSATAEDLCDGMSRLVSRAGPNTTTGGLLLGILALASPCRPRS